MIMRLTREEQQWLNLIKKKQHNSTDPDPLHIQTPIDVFLFSYGLLRLKKKIPQPNQQWSRVKRKKIAARNRAQTLEEELLFQKKKKTPNEKTEKIPKQYIHAYVSKIKTL